ncbi:MAG: Na+:solute symporter [Arenicellales bacterium]|nr:Na+:solute symporter [Arenicellales bacterium]
MVDFTILLLFIAYSVWVGLRSRRKASQSLDEYFLAGRQVKGWRAGLSMCATQFAADTPLLVTGLIATSGIFALWRLWIYALAFLLMAFVFAACWRRAGVLTDAELTETRYSGPGVLLLRVLKAVYYGTVINCVVMAIVLIAAVRIAEVFLPWHAWLPENLYTSLTAVVRLSGLFLAESVTGLPSDVATTNALISILMILIFVALYSTTGGLRSVITTDIVQFGIAMLATIVYAYAIVRHIGGLDGITDQLVSLYGTEDAERLVSFSPPLGELMMPFLVIISLQWLFQMNSDGTGYLAQRSLACRTDRDAGIAGIVFAWTQILLRSLIWMLIGVGLLIIYPFNETQMQAEGFAAARELTFVTGIDELLPIGLRGIMLTGLLAALASTLDTHLNWGASYWANDIYGRLFCREWRRREPSNRELVVAARVSNIIVVLIALVVMANLASIQQAWFISLLFGAGMGSVLVLRWLWERINLYSELSAMVVSLLAAPILLTTIDAEWLRLASMALLSTLAVIVVTWFTPPTHDQTLLSFYKRVRPLGWWRSTASMAGSHPNEPLIALAQSLITTGLCALSLFLLLIGLGKLLLHGHNNLQWVVVLAGLVLVPFWWRRINKTL